MLTPSEYDHLCDRLIFLYDELDRSIIEDMTRRMMRMGYVSEATKWQAKQLQESGLLYVDILAEIAKRTDATQNHVRAIFEDAGVQSIRNDNNRYRSAGLSGIVKMSDSALQTLNAGYIKCRGNLHNLTLTTANTAQQEYINACDLAYMQVTSGTMDYGTAVRRAVQSTASKGSWVLYPTGHRDRLDVAVRRSVLTGVGQTVRQLSAINAKDMGCDLMEITAHAGARPSHAQWQGQIVSLSGRKGYLSPRDIGYGTGDGFGGWNCRHDWYPYFEGISERAYSEERLRELNARNIEINGQKYTEYEVSQMQRKLERKVREMKRRVLASETAVKNAPDQITANQMQDFFASESAKLKKAEQKLKDFLNQTGNLPDSTRTWVNGFGRSTAQKAVHASKKFKSKNSNKLLDNSQNSGIIGSNNSNNSVSVHDVRSAEEYARNVLGIPNVSYRGVDIVTANEWNRGLEESLKRFPELRKQIKFVGTTQERNKIIEKNFWDYYIQYEKRHYPEYDNKQLKDVCTGLVNLEMERFTININSISTSLFAVDPNVSNANGITINEIFGKNSSKLLELLKLNEKNKFHPISCNTILSQLDHEIAHQLDALLKVSNMPEIRELFDSITNEELTYMLSEYSWNNKNSNKYSEKIAEAWSEYCNNPHPRTIAKFVGETIVNTYKEKFNN